MAEVGHGFVGRLRRHDCPSTSVATPLDDVDRTMAYQSELGEGEVRVDETDTGVIVRVGPPNGKKYLVKKVVSIGGLVFIDFYIAVMLLVIIVAQPQLPPDSKCVAAMDTRGGRAILTGMLIWGDCFDNSAISRSSWDVDGYSIAEGIEFREANAPEKAMVLNHSEISGFDDGQWLGWRVHYSPWLQGIRASDCCGKEAGGG